jgi:hypothetical protein
VTVVAVVGVPLRTPLTNFMQVGKGLDRVNLNVTTPVPMKLRMFRHSSPTLHQRLVRDTL